MIRKLLLLCLTSIYALANGQMSRPYYKLYDVQAKKEISFEKLLERTAQYNVVFLGEEHNDSIAHVLQNQLFVALHQKNPTTALSMEMLVTDDQLVLDEYLQGLITEKNFTKDAVLWNNYSDYRPMVEYAKTHKLAVIAANAPSRYTNRVTQKGLSSLSELSKRAKSYLAPLPIDTLTGAYAEKFNALLGGHSGMGNLKIYQSQNLWDATMAYRIAQHLKTDKKAKILHLNGRFHSDERLGTVAQLKKYAPKSRIGVISCFPSEDFDQPDWSKHQHLGDYIILTDPKGPKTF